MKVIIHSSVNQSGIRSVLGISQYLHWGLINNVRRGGKQSSISSSLVSKTTQCFWHLGINYFLTSLHLCPQATLAAEPLLSKSAPPDCTESAQTFTLYLMEILSNNNATVDPVWEETVWRVCTKSSSVASTCHVVPFLWIFDCDHANPFFWWQVWNLYSVNICIEINDRTYCIYCNKWSKFVLQSCNTSR